MSSGCSRFKSLRPKPELHIQFYNTAMYNYHQVVIITIQQCTIIVSSLSLQYSNVQLSSGRYHYNTAMYNYRQFIIITIQHNDITAMYNCHKVITIQQCTIAIKSLNCTASCNRPSSFTWSQSIRTVSNTAVRVFMLVPLAMLVVLTL